MSGLVKDIVERPSAVASSSKAPSAPKPPSLSQSNGFPSVTHRSLKPPSAFVKARQERERLAKLEASGQLRQDGKPPVIKAADEADDGPLDMDEMQNMDKVKAMSSKEREQEKAELLERFGGNLVSIMQRRRESRQGKGKAADVETVAEGSAKLSQGFDEAQNQATVDAMSAEEREQEKAELLERFGGNLTDIMKRRQQARAQGQNQKSGVPQFMTVESSQLPVSDTTERRQVRFAEDPSPQTVPKIDPSEPLPDEDEDPFSPGSIHRTYFPTTTHDASKLEWIQAPSKTASEDRTVRFNLSGEALDHDQASKLPSHLGLHHHGSSPDLAGYTLRDIYHLCLSTVPSQRITMYDVLAKIVARHMLGELNAEAREECVKEQVNSKAIELATGVLAGLEKNSNVIRVAVGLLYEAIGGSLWAGGWLDAVAAARYPFFALREQGRMDDLIAQVPFDALVSRFTRLLALNQPDISALTTHHILRALRRVAIHSQALADTICPLVPIAVSTHLMGTTNPQLDARPSLEALHLLLDVTTSSRTCAEALIAQNVYEPLIRFVASYINELSVLDDDQGLRQQLCVGVLRVFTALGRYGLMASITVTAAEIWRDLGALVTRNISSSSTQDSQQVAEAYLDACTIWLTCAIDPHRIVPDHDVTWAQVTAMGWPEEALDILEETLPWSGQATVIVSALRMVGAWLRGAKINEPLSGAAQKDLIRQRPSLYNAVKQAARADDPRLATASVELLHAVDDVVDPELAGFLTERCEVSVEDSLEAKKEYALLAAATLNAQQRASNADATGWAGQAARLMLRFTPGDEPVALDLLDEMLRRGQSDERQASMVEAIGYKDGLLLLRPLLQHTILPDISNLVGPVNASPVYLKNTSTLRHPHTLERVVLPAEQSSGPPAPIVGLPLTRDWMYSPLNELLQSGTSQSLAQVPPSWDASEVEITRATLLFANIYQLSLIEGGDRSLRLLNLTKVFMLEHGQQNSPNPHNGEVFRDQAVSAALDLNLAPLLLRQSLDTHISTTSTMEQAALPFLGSGVPFFQFFVDFLALFEAISLSDASFTRLVIPPLSQLYPVDFRKHIWCDQPTSLRSIRLSLADVPVETDISHYFYPQEPQADVLAGYTRALINRWVTKSTHPFMYLLAVHHLASTLWAEEDDTSVRDNLMKAVFKSAPVAVLRDLLEYEPSPQITEESSHPASAVQQAQRKARVASVSGQQAISRLDQ